MLILGCGNPDRGDDGAGPAVARLLRQLGVDAQDHPGDAFALLDAFGRDSDVILIDATETSAPPGTVKVWDALTRPLPAAALRCSTHAFGPAEAVELARAMDRLPARLIVYGIEGARFQQGAPLSYAVARSAEKVAKQIAERLTAKP